MDAFSEEATKAANDSTIWVRSVYKPTRFGTGVLLSMKAGAPIWPTEPYLGLATGELGKLIPEALGGTMTPKQALDAAAVAYTKAATSEFLRNARLQVEALNHALRNVPAERIRMHVCRGNYEGPHHRDIGLEKILDVVLKAKPATVLFEGANPRHAHKWEV